MQISFTTVMFWGCHWAPQTFISVQRFSVGLRSGNWLGHSKTLKRFSGSHSFITLVLFEGSLWCWKTQPCLIFNGLTDGSFHSKCHHTWPHSFFLLHWSIILVPLQGHLPGRYGVLWMQLSIPSPPNTMSGAFDQKVLLWFHLTTWYSPNPRLDH